VNAYAAALGIAVKDKLKETRQAMAEMYVNQGNAYLKLHREDDALAAYSKGAALSDDPGKAYFNLCATYYNTGKTDQALSACDKAIAADPNKADAYFIKGSVLMAEATIDAQGKATYPAGTAEALQMYMKLAPTGAHAADTQQMLDYIRKP
jgi:tetratricopeptide (TPR) repeat protein